MAHYPIALTVPQYHVSGAPASGYVLKAYQDGTSTLLQMATDNTGGTLVNTVTLNSQGYPTVSGNVIIPHVDQAYKLSLYPSQAAADANSGAVWTIDNLTPFNIVANLAFNGNTISSTNSNGDITLDPNGSGSINLSAAVVCSSSITGSTIELTSTPDVTGYTKVRTTYLHNDGADSTGFDVDANITEGTFESIGPTGSSATNIWTPLDSAPSGARAAILKLEMTFTTSATSGGGINLYGRRTGSSAGTTELTNLAGYEYEAAAIGDVVVLHYSNIKVPLDSSRRMDLTWVATVDSARGIEINLQGFEV